MTFSKDAFLGSQSGKTVRHLLSDHLDMLDGLPVTNQGEHYGHIDYTMNGEAFTLYPVMPEWCSGQETLFAPMGRG